MIHETANPLARPIGYWLKLLDGLIESAFDRALAEHQVARRHWQTLNALAHGEQDAAALSEALRPFWADGAITLGQAVCELRERGWISSGPGGVLRLTTDGEAARSAIAERVAAVRTQVMAGLAPEEYESTVRALARMAGNLQAPA